MTLQNSTRNRPSSKTGGNQLDELAARGGRDSVFGAASAEFLSRIAHDLRSPLSVVSGALNELGSDFASQLTEEHKTLLAVAGRGLQRLARLADRISLASCLESGRLDLSTQDMDLFAAVRDGVHSATTMVRRRDVELHSEIPDEPVRVRGDPRYVGQIIEELVCNAIAHARRSVTVRASHTDGEACVIIEDDGDGVPIELRETLYHRFTPSRSRSGLGVGLSIASTLTHAHGGTLFLEERSTHPSTSKGARFVFILPTTRPASPDSTKP